MAARRGGDGGGLQAALAWGLEHSDPQVLSEQAAQTRATGTLPQVDTKWMDALFPDDIARMRECVAVLSDESTQDEHRQEALETLQYYCESIDLANDLPKIGGLPVVLRHATHPTASVREKAAWVLGTMVHNNPQCQTKVAEEGGTKVIMELVRKETDEGVRAKALNALSGLISHHATNQREFMEDEGLPVVMDIVAHGSEGLRTRAVFLMGKLVAQADVYAHSLQEMNGFHVFLDVLRDVHMGCDFKEKTLSTLQTIMACSKDYVHAFQGLGLDRVLCSVEREAQKGGALDPDGAGDGEGVIRLIDGLRDLCKHSTSSLAASSATSSSIGDK